MKLFVESSARSFKHIASCCGRHSPGSRDRERASGLSLQGRWTIRPPGSAPRSETTPLWTLASPRWMRRRRTCRPSQRWWLPTASFCHLKIFNGMNTLFYCPHWHWYGVTVGYKTASCTNILMSARPLHKCTGCLYDRVFEIRIYSKYFEEIKYCNISKIWL